MKHIIYRVATKSEILEKPGILEIKKNTKTSIFENLEGI